MADKKHEKERKEEEPQASAPADSGESHPQPELTPADEGEGSGDEELAALSRLSDEDSLEELMSFNFIEYASYVIKDRAIPDVYDGLKPVQRRILHSLYELDDGRFHKVANIIGHTMKYHPHGDQSIGNALVVLANKEYFIDRQGNFGNILTGDQASAARYIECRLTPLAREVMFNPEITEFVDSYDSRNREPVTLPAKVPSLLMLGAEGIAVGMSTHVLTHNFNELLQAQIAILEGKPFQVYPDFLSGGIMDVKDYADGDGRVVVRAKIDALNEKTLVIREVPSGTTTESLMASIEEAARRGKIKIAGINDYTAEKVEIEVSLPRGVYADEVTKQLYAYTDCQVSLTSNMIVIRDNRPVRMTVSEVLKLNTEKLVSDLKRELEIELGKLQERFHEKTLAQIFIENRIYKRIEECETFEKVMGAVRKGLEKFRDQLKRDITDADIEKLLQIQIRRISLFDINRNKEELEKILEDIGLAEHNLKHLRKYTIKYIQGLLKKYGDLYPRRTQIADLESIDVREVALQNVRVGHDRVSHFVGTAVKNSNRDDEPVVCTEFDRLVLLGSDGKFKVIPIPEKVYAGPVKYVLRSDKQQIYSMIYRDRRKKTYFAKRFRINSFIMDKEYTALPPGCIIEVLSDKYGVLVRCEFEPNNRLKSKYVDVNFDEVPLRATGARGFKIADHPVQTFSQLKRGTSAPTGDGEAPPEQGQPAGEQTAAATAGAVAEEGPAAEKVAVAVGKSKTAAPSTTRKSLSRADMEEEAERQGVKVEHVGDEPEDDEDEAEAAERAGAKKTGKGRGKKPDKASAVAREKASEPAAVASKRREAEDWDKRSAKAAKVPTPEGRAESRPGADTVSGRRDGEPDAKAPGRRGGIRSEGGRKSDDTGADTGAGRVLPKRQAPPDDEPAGKGKEKDSGLRPTEPPRKSTGRSMRVGSGKSALSADAKTSIRDTAERKALAAPATASAKSASKSESGRGASSSESKPAESAKASSKTSSAASRAGRRLIDEETPFFLEQP
ncbi:MAG: hypothetical protein A3K19_26785 [Lentisphaerae bacterium RIFOXYB12_FULL_65_16]|nr:MAG: hypothetical protein A3K18_03375 [Lentisphaerae bacterium RIFOXYA12_64_32]OGV84326.1 MAG: hypothetical protein A3K19_26785 [Lentisphaerae bacterium RIFOXYB12_FULL_65_16]